MSGTNNCDSICALRKKGEKNTGLTKKNTPVQKQMDRPSPGECVIMQEKLILRLNIYQLKGPTKGRRYNSRNSSAPEQVSIKQWPNIQNH